MRKKAMNEHNFKTLVKKYYETMLESLINFVNIDSVYDASTVSEANPYGVGVTNALNFVTNLAKKDGFSVKNIKNRVVEIYFGDPSKPNIGVFAHADVVPATGDWVSPPFAAEIRDGKLYARGTSDDKGPAIAAYYAIKALHDAGLINEYSVRLVIGGDEERGSSCMHFYFNKHNAPAPDYGFTPDAVFPLIYGEKGITNFIGKKTVDLGPILTIKGGEASNSVIDKVVVTLPTDQALLSYLTNAKVPHRVSEEGALMTLTILGKSAHGSLPELGINAGVLLFKHFGHFYKNAYLSRLGEKLSNPSGKTMDAFLSSPLLHDSTYNMGLLSYQGGVLKFTINFRYPEDINVSDHLARLSITLDTPLTIESEREALLFDPASPFIQMLLKAYQDETGDQSSVPLAIGGGTYAKECPNTVAFGSAFVGRDGDIHSPNEQVLITDLYDQMAIYARAIYYLGTKLCG